MSRPVREGHYLRDAYGSWRFGRSTMMTESYRYMWHGMRRPDGLSDPHMYITPYRLYDVRLGRWNTRDPIFNPSVSPYEGMGSNPIVFVDALGTDYTASRKGNEVTITIAIKIHGNGASPSKAKQIQRAIKRAWSRKNGWAVKDRDGNNVTVRIVTSVEYIPNDNIDFQQEQRNGVNIIRITDDVAAYDKNTAVATENARKEDKLRWDGVSHVSQGNKGVWIANDNDKGKTYVHEVAHLLGLPDMYRTRFLHPWHDVKDLTHGKGAFYTEPVDGYKNNILGTSNGKVEPRNIEAVVSKLPTGDFDTRVFRATDIKLPGMPLFAPTDGRPEPKTEELSNPLAPVPKSAP